MPGAWIAAFVALSLGFVVLSLLGLGTLHRVGPLLERLEQLDSEPHAVDFAGLRPGASVPDFRLNDGDGHEVWFSQLIGEPMVVLFVQEGCTPCEQLVEELHGYRGNTPLVLVGGYGEHTARLTDNNRMRLLEQVDHEASRAFSQSSFPQAFFVSATGTVISRAIPNHIAHIERLIEAIPTDMPATASQQTNGGGDHRDIQSKVEVGNHR